MKTHSFFPRLCRAALCLWVLLVAGHASAGTVDLADRPLSSMSDGTLVRSNLMFVLDDSGSMSSNYLPDNAPTDDVCFGSVDRNLIFYDPSRTYNPPLRADGSVMNDASFTAAWNDGYNPVATDVVDLTNNNPETPYITGATVGTPTSTSTTVVCGRRNDASCVPPASTSIDTYDSSTDTTKTVDTFVARVDAPGLICKANVANSCALRTTKITSYSQGRIGTFLWATRKAGASSTTCAATNFDIVRAVNATEAQKKNYANWFSYYRTRMLAMRAGAGRAFALIDASRFRVGFSKISEYANGGADSPGFLNVRDYDTQKTDFFTRLYSTEGNSNTPLRPALARAGRYFANKLSGQSDPMQYSCQRNYTILSTDGYWNEPTVIPKRIDGTDIGNTDAGTGVDRPMRDAINNGAGVSNSLADVAQYYYITDLRTPELGNCTGSKDNQDVCENRVPTDAKDTNNAQHMTTFTMGLGLSGTLTYSKDYETKQGSGAFWDIKQGNKVWPDPISNTAAERIDDLWHAAVNGRGTYYSASNATDMAASLVDALTKIDLSTGSSSAAATSSLTPSAGDDWLFVPLYTTKTWDGTVNAFKINTATGAVLNPDTPIWSAAERIKTQSSRNIWFNSGGTLREFNETNLDAAGKLSLFGGLCTVGAEKLSQCASLVADAKAKATATNLISFLRGSAAYEQTATAEADKVFRTRKSPLGDIVNGAPVYVKQSPLNLSGTGHSAFAATARAGVLYVGANDGMLHAIKVVDKENKVEDDKSGTELWAYVPSMVMSNMYLLADANYESKHRFFVDGAPVVSDIYDGAKWRTILVGGLGKGGRGYYALDVTDPALPPQLLWEFTETNLGYSYGNPVITKDKAGRWVVMFTSGYNNVSPGDGGGYLYVVDALTGASVSTIPTLNGGTNVGTATTPSNLGKINIWVDDDKTGVATRVYGGDMLGNVWRFDFDDNLAPSGKEAVRLAQTAGATQPITTKPVLTEIIDGNYKYPVVSVATGRYLGTSDVGDKSLQSIYTFKDELTATGMGSLRATGMVKQTFNSDRNGLVAGATIDWGADKGWYVDLSLSEGERVNVDFDQQLNQLIVASNVPKPSVCSPGGTSWLYYLDVGSGKPLLTYSGTTLVAGTTTIVSSTGKLVTLVQQVDGKNTSRQGADPANLPAGTLRRTSWRELMN